jgi:predicted component of type VI protein secretion system
MPLNAKLIVVGGDVKTAEIKLRLPSTIGRGRGASIMLPHPLVSRQHCELFESQGKLMVRDLGSLNGTFINNERISEAPLPTGELLTIGAVTFRAIYEVDTSAKTVDADADPAIADPAADGAARAGDPHGTVRAPGKPPRTSAPTVNLDEPIEAELGSDNLGSGDVAGSDDFDLSQPVNPVDEGARVTLRAEAPALPAEEPSAEARKTDPSVPGSSGKPAAAEPPASGSPGSKPTATKSPEMPGTKSPEKPATKPGKLPEKKDEPTVHFAAWEDEEGEVRPAVVEDEDFGDFLKSLEKKQ